MKNGRLLDLTLRELLKDYCVVKSLECDYIYGICSDKDAGEICNKYDLEDGVSLTFEPLIDEEVSIMISDNYELLSLDKMEKICGNLKLNKD